MAKLNIRGLGLTAKQWGLYDEEDLAPKDRARVGVAVDALNQALREAATAVQDEMRTGGPLRGAKLNDAIERALYDHWEDVAAQYKKMGAADTEVMERAAAALRKLFRGVQEDVGMRGLLRGLEEAAGGANDRDLLKRLEGANQHWRAMVLGLRAKGEYLYAGEVPKDIARVDMVYVPKAAKASYEGEYTAVRDGEDLKTGQPSRQFRRMDAGRADPDSMEFGGEDVRIWVRADGKITWD